MPMIDDKMKLAAKLARESFQDEEVQLILRDFLSRELRLPPKDDDALEKLLRRLANKFYVMGYQDGANVLLLKEL